MDIREACEDIMGEKLAASIIADMGLRWCVVSAIADPRSDERPKARAVISAWLKEQKGRSR